MRILKGPVLIIMISIFTVCGCVSCGQTMEEPPQEGISQEDESSQNSRMILKIGCQSADDSSEFDVLSYFEKLVEEKSNHEIDIQIFPSSSLGSVADLVEGVTLGTVEMAAVGFSSYVPYCNDFAIYDPWMFTGPEDFVKLYDSAVGAQLNQKLLETAGIRILSYNLCSPGQMYFWGNEELTTVSSYKGLKVRTNGMSTVSVAIEALEAVPTAVPWKDMYTAIQAKTLDVGLGDVENILNTNYDTIITYRYSGPKNYLGSSVCISEKAWQALSDEYRVILEESMINACQNYGKQVYEKKVAMGEDALLQTSIQTLEMEPGEREKMTLLMREAVEEYLSTTVSPNLLKQARPFFSEP